MFIKKCDAHLGEHGMSGSGRVDDIHGYPQGEVRGATTHRQNQRRRPQAAAQQGITAEAAIGKGLEQKATEFAEKGAQLYTTL